MDKRIHCKECGTEYDGIMPSCPSCGNMTPNSKNKGLIQVLWGIIVLFLLAGGGLLYLYFDHQAWKDDVAEQKRQELLKDSLDNARMLQIAQSDKENADRVQAEREQSINEIEAACAERERATAIRDKQLLAELDRAIAENRAELQKRKQASQGTVKKGNNNAQANQGNVNSGNNADSQNDLRILDALEGIEQQIAQEKQNTSKKLSDYYSAYCQYGATMPAHSYRTVALRSISEVKRLCSRALNYVNQLKTIDGSDLRNHFKMQLDASETLYNETYNLGIEDERLKLH